MSSDAKMIHQHLKLVADGNQALSDQTAAMIGDPIGLSRKQVTRALGELVDAKLIQVDVRQGAKSVISFVVEQTRAIPGILDEPPRRIDQRRKHVQNGTSDMSQTGQVTCPKRDMHMSQTGHDMAENGQVSRICRQGISDIERGRDCAVDQESGAKRAKKSSHSTEENFSPVQATIAAFAEREIPPDDNRCPEIEDGQETAKALIAALERLGVSRERQGGWVLQRIASMSADVGGDARLVVWLNRAADAGEKGLKPAAAWITQQIYASKPLKTEPKELGRVRSTDGRYANVKSKF